MGALVKIAIGSLVALVLTGGRKNAEAGRGGEIGPAPSRPAGGLPRRYDALFREHGPPGIPVEFWRAVAWHESRMQPTLINPSSRAAGMMQIVSAALQDFETTTGENVLPPQLLEPETSVRIAALTFTRIRGAYGAIPLREDWSDPDWVELFVAGWNAGYSLRGGVGLVARELVRRGQPVTVDRVHELTGNGFGAPSTRFLAMPKRRRWWRRVTATYFAELRSGGVS